MATELNKWQKELIRLSKRKYKEVDAQLFNTYKDALKEIKQRLQMYTNTYEQLSFSKRLEVERLFNVAKEMDNILTAAGAKVEDIIKDYSTNQAIQGYNGVWYQLEQSENITMGMPVIDHDYIATIVNKPVAGKILSERLYQNREKVAKATSDAIVNGMLNGDGYKVIAKRISDLTEANYKQSLRIAITEAGRVQSITTQKGYEESEKLGVKMEKTWLATLDRKTRHDHRQLDGQTVGIKEKFKVPDFDHYAEGPRLFGIAHEDINCRCTTIIKVNDIAPELRKDNVYKDYVPFMSYEEWSSSVWGARSAE